MGKRGGGIWETRKAVPSFGRDSYFFQNPASEAATNARLPSNWRSREKYRIFESLRASLDVCGALVSVRESCDSRSSGWRFSSAVFCVPSSRDSQRASNAASVASPHSNANCCRGNSLYHVDGCCFVSSPGGSVTLADAFLRKRSTFFRTHASRKRASASPPRLGLIRSGDA